MIVRHDASTISRRLCKNSPGAIGYLRIRILQQLLPFWQIQDIVFNLASLDGLQEGRDPLAMIQ